MIDAPPLKVPASSATLSSAEVEVRAKDGSSQPKSDVESKGGPPKTAETQSTSSEKPLKIEEGSTGSTPASTSIPNAATFQSEDTGKTSTPQPASIPKRPESARPAPTASSARPSPSLPNKPERPDPRGLRSDSRFPGRPTLPGDSSREPRDPRSQDYGRRGEF